MGNPAPQGQYMHRYRYLPEVLHCAPVVRLLGNILYPGGGPPPTFGCIASLQSQFAMEFEVNHILDWVAWHNLGGVDCFLLFYDTARSNFSNHHVLSVWT